MKTRSCPACSWRVSKKAKFCPSCGHVIRRGGCFPAVILALVLLGVVALFLPRSLWRAANEQWTQWTERAVASNGSALEDAASSSAAPVPAPSPSIRPGAPAGAVTILKTAVTHYITAQGREAREVRLTWRNDGTRPVHQLWGDVTFYWPNGKAEKHTKCCFFTSESDLPVAPGEIHEEPYGKGYLVLPSIPDFLQVERVEVEITRVRTDPPS